MAQAAINVTIGQSLGGGRYSSKIKNSTVPSAPSTTTVTADVATLVADGASPTQAHVTTLNADYTTLTTAITGLNAAIAGDVTLIWDTGTITSLNQLRHALSELSKLASSGYGGLAE
jgi:hypothetical protein